PPAPPAPPKIELPSNNAAYLNNPAPNYPAISRRMGEQGTVMLRIFVDAQGLPQKIEVSKSSGYDRLDQQAVDGVKNWKFVPGKSNGTPTPMWVTVPVKFTLN
ncbi:energy transducer TonB, partial [Delftia sp. CH05]